MVVIDVLGCVRWIVISFWYVCVINLKQCVMGKSLLSPYRRIVNVMKFYSLRGLNSERVNLVYRKIVVIRFGVKE